MRDRGAGLRDAQAHFAAQRAPCGGVLPGLQGVAVAGLPARFSASG
jgi:hypothetical protein